MLNKVPFSANRRRMLMILAGALSAGLILSSCASPVAPTSQPGSTTLADDGSTSATKGSDMTVETTAVQSDQETTVASTVSIEPGLVTPDQALALLEQEPDALLIDVRTDEEYKTGHIPDSILMPVDELESLLGELPSDKETALIVYCRTGRRSAAAADMLRKAGYTRVFDLGGIVSWPYDIVT